MNYVAIMVEAANAGTAAAAAAVVQKSLKFQFVFAKPVQLAKFHCSGRSFEEMTLLRPLLGWERGHP